VGPLLAAILVLATMPPGRTRAVKQSSPPLLDFRPVLRNRATRAYIVGYFAGFSAAFLAPLVFGIVLDLAGGNRSTVAWGLAFASIGIFGALSTIARAPVNRKNMPR
jgi:MFS family permease